MELVAAAVEVVPDLTLRIDDKFARRVNPKVGLCKSFGEDDGGVLVLRCCGVYVQFDSTFGVVNVNPSNVILFLKIWNLVI